MTAAALVDEDGHPVDHHHLSPEGRLQMLLREHFARGVPALIRPPFSSTTWSKRRAASSRSWVETSTVTALALRSASRSEGGLPRGDVHPGEGLVEEQDVRLLSERPGKEDPLLLTTGEFPDGPLGQVGDAHALQAAPHDLSIFG